MYKKGNNIDLAARNCV